MKTWLYIIVLSFLIYGCKNDKKEQTQQTHTNQSSAKQRNVIFILSDDHRYDYMGFTGKVPWLKTPNMDKLAKEGAYMKNAFVTTSLCSPSRASILTGQYSHVHTIVDNYAPDPGNLIYFPEYLQKAGYQTAFFGKWHMGDHSDKQQPGFDHWESFEGQGVYYNPKLNINGKRIQYKDSTYTTDLLTKHTLDWLENRDKDKPFFAYLSHKSVHAEFKPAKRHKGMYKGKSIEYPPTYTQTLSNEYKDLKWPEWVNQQRYSWHGVDYMYHKHNVSLDSMVVDYNETLMGVDESIGSVMDWLKANNLDQNTLVIYMGDNGFSWGEHGLIDKRHAYEESIKVPMLVHCPELFEGGKTVDAMVQNIDIAPTILDMENIKKPEYMPGDSFIKVIKGDTKNWRKKIFYEYFWEFDFPMTPTVFAVRTDKYKYIRYYGIWDSNELYDLENDPDEVYNIIDKPEHQELVKKLAGELYDWLEETNGMNIPLKRTIKYPWGDYKHAKQY